MDIQKTTFPAKHHVPIAEAGQLQSLQRCVLKFQRHINHTVGAKYQKQSYEPWCFGGFDDECKLSMGMMMRMKLRMMMAIQLINMRIRVITMMIAMMVFRGRG